VNDPSAVHVLGVDAGATNTRIVLSGPDRQDMGMEITGPFNLRQDHPKQLLSYIDTSLLRLIPKKDRIDITVRAIAIGAAGVGTHEEREAVRSVIQSEYKLCHVYVHHDAFIAHHGAFEGQPGVMVTAGTGSIAYGRNSADQEVRAGGWGWLLGDEGSGWWIAREAVRAALAHWEGSGPETLITELLTDTFQVGDAYELIPKIYADKIKRTELIALVEQLAVIARDGDVVALNLFTRAGGEIAELAINCAKRLNMSPGELKVALLGGVATGAADLITPGILASWESDTDGADGGCPAIVEPIMDAVHGAVHWGRDQLINRSYA
jgi:glucosamine kinase